MADWMAAVPDGTKLTEMTIPGTHNLAAYRVVIQLHFCATQCTAERYTEKYAERYAQNVSTADACKT